MRCLSFLFTAHRVPGRSHGFAAVWLLAVSAGFITAPAVAAPAYDFDRPQLEAILVDLKAWLPGEWSSFPQVWYDRNVHMPAAGEHEHWHRTFALIDAPQVGATVFYGQINIGGPQGPILGRSQVLYKAFINEAKGVVTIHGQPLADAGRYVDLHKRPELWDEVRMPDEAALRCQFDWRRQGRQLVGVLDNRDGTPVPAGGKADGTCVYPANNDVPFLADAEWVLSRDELWLYDINLMGGVQFVGRTDRTHLRLYRTTAYRCSASDPTGKRDLPAHDRGFRVALTSSADTALEAMLLRAWYPDEERGLTDELRLALTDSNGEAIVTAKAPPGAGSIAVSGRGVEVSCVIGSS